MNFSIRIETYDNTDVNDIINKIKETLKEFKIVREFEVSKRNGGILHYIYFTK